MTVRLMSALILCASLAGAQDTWSVRADFEDLPPGRPARPADDEFARRVSPRSTGDYTDDLFAEIAPDAGPDGSQALRVVDHSEEQNILGFFHMRPGDGLSAEALTLGAIRLDVYFEDLPSRPFTIGRRNFGVAVAADGRVLGPAGLDEPEWGRDPEFVCDWFRFREGTRGSAPWYSLLIQYDAQGDPEHGGGAFSVFAREWDGTDAFDEDDLIIRGAAYAHNNNDQWGRIVETRHADPKATGAWLLDNFAIDDGTAHHLPAGQRRPAALADPEYIRVPADADGETLVGARELSEYLQRATARACPVVRANAAPAPDAAAPHFEVGTEAAREMTADLLAGAESDDAFAIVARDGLCAIAGKSDRATRYGCCDFLERFVGVRWYMPGEFGEVVPALARLRVPEVALVEDPVLAHRWCSGVLCDFGSAAEWLDRMRMRSTIRFHHNLLNIFDVRRYGETDPDLYPLINGERFIPEPGAHNWQPCLKHPRAVEITMEYAREQFAAGADSISLGINDSQSYCECADCMQFVREDEPREMRRTRWFLQYANEVARRVAQEFPGKRIGYLAYGQTLDIPDDVRAEPNLVPFLVNKSADLNPDGVIDLDRWRTEEPSWERLEAWHAMIRRTQEHFPSWALYDWYFGAGRKAAPNLHYDAIRHYLRYAVEHGCMGLYVESYPNWGLDGHKYWFYYKTVWDPEFDARARLDEFYVRFFGDAAEPMRRYCEAVERLTFIDGAGPETLDPYTPEAVAECRGHLDEARAAVAGDPGVYRQRVAYYTDAFGLTAILAARRHAAVAANRLLEEDAPMAQVVAALATGWGADKDVDLYYAWALDEDRYQFRRPGGRHLGQYPAVFDRAAARLAEDPQADQVRASLGDDERALELFDALLRAVR